MIGRRRRWRVFMLAALVAGSGALATMCAARAYVDMAGARLASPTAAPASDPAPAVIPSQSPDQAPVKPPVEVPAPASEPIAAPDTFRVFNAMLYTDMPDFGERLPVVYEQHFFPDRKADPDGTPTSAGLADAIRNAREQQAEAARRMASLVVLDIERWHLWPFVGLDVHKESLARYGKTARQFRERFDAPICYYSILPSGGINAAFRSSTDEGHAAEWQQANALIADAVVPHVDALCPQLYAYYSIPRRGGEDSGLEQWKVAASQTVALGRRLAAGKPVYAFIWPQFHAGGSFKDYPFVPAEYWRAQLVHLRGLVDGVILWGGWNFKTNRQLAWDDQAAWWQVFNDVMGAPLLRTGTERLNVTRR